VTVNISTDLRNRACNVIVDAIDEGSTAPNGYLEIRTGTKPDTPQLPAAGSLLATLNFSTTAFGDAVSGVATANTITGDTSIDETGTATWFRIYNRDSIALIDGDITLTGGGGDIEFDDTVFIEGGTALITTLTGVMPQ
jgi:hypothetical protein